MAKVKVSVLPVSAKIPVPVVATTPEGRVGVAVELSEELRPLMEEAEVGFVTKEVVA